MSDWTPEVQDRLEYFSEHSTWKSEGQDVAAALREIERLGNNLIAQEQITLLRNKDLLKSEAKLAEARAEIERLSEQLRLCTVPDGWETWRRNAEAEINLAQGRADEEAYFCRDAEAKLAKEVSAHEATRRAGLQTVATLEAKLAEVLTLLRRVEIEGSEEITTAHAARREAEAREAKLREWAETAYAWGPLEPEGYSSGYADAQKWLRAALAASPEPAPPEEKQG